MRRHQSQIEGPIVVLLLLSSANMFQSGIVSQSFAQFQGQSTQPPRPTEQPGNETWFHTFEYSVTGARTYVTRTWGPPSERNQTWTRMGNQSWTRIQNETYTYAGNRTTWTWTGPPGPPGPLGNQTTRTEENWPAGNETHSRGGGPSGLLKGWAHSNITIDAKNVTHPLFMNGTGKITSISINATSDNQVIRYVAFNETVTQIQFDHNGTVQLSINSSVKPAQVFGDNAELPEAQSLNGLTKGEAWSYDQTGHVLIILADPSSITIFYEPTSSPVPEFPTTPAIVLIVSLIAILAVARRRVLLHRHSGTTDSL